MIDDVREREQFAADEGSAPGLAQRREAAARLLRANPTRSDREVGRAVGLSAGTVSAIRRSLGERRAAQVRVGGDGRSRPVSADGGRRAAARLLAERPSTPVRELAREAGISLGTAHDVRRRVLAGLPPVPDGRAESRSSAAAAFDALRRDPAVRYSEAGRTMLRRMEAQLLAAGQLAELSAQLPPHCQARVEELLRHIGTSWTDAARTVLARQPRSTEKIDG